jgi:hypothetical protein
MGPFYERCDELRERIRSYAIAGYLRLRSSFFLIAILLFIFYTVCVILSTTVKIWSPFLDSGHLENSSGKDFGQVASEVPAVTSEVPAITSEISSISSAVSASPSKAPAISSAVPAIPSKPPGIHSGNPPEKSPVIDVGKPLGKDPVIDVGYTKYQGITHDTGVTQWLGIRYAAPPLGDLRFAVPQDPLKQPEVQRADKVRFSLRTASALRLTHYSVARNA